MKIALDILINRDAINAQLASVNYNLRNDPVLGLSQVSAGVIGAIITQKATCCKDRALAWFSNRNQNVAKYRTFVKVGKV